MKRKNRISTFDYCKLILKKVSFSSFLFERELRKAIRSCAPLQLPALKRWCLKKFWQVYHGLILNSFARMGE